MPHRRESGEIVTILVILLVVLAALFGGYKLIGVAADALAEWVPDELETKVFGPLGEHQSGWTDRASTKERLRAENIFAKLKVVKGLRALPYQLRFSESSDANAFALPGGTISVTDGLLDMVKSDVGLATVIAHEFGHQQKRHALKAMGRSLIIAGILIVVVGDTSAIISLVVNAVENAYSRDQEVEADDYGLRLVYKVYGTTDGALEFFSKVSADDKLGRSGKLLAMISTHPYTPDRIEHLRRLALELDAQKP